MGVRKRFKANVIPHIFPSQVEKRVQPEEPPAPKRIRLNIASDLYQPSTSKMCESLESQHVTSELKLFSFNDFKWDSTTCQRSSSPNNSIIKDEPEEHPDDTCRELNLVGIMQEIQRDIKLLSKKYDDLVDSVGFCGKKISDLETSLANICTKIKEIDNLKSENAELKKTVAELTLRVDEMQQYLRLNNIEIPDIDEDKTKM